MIGKKVRLVRLNKCRFVFEDGFNITAINTKQHIASIGNGYLFGFVFSSIFGVVYKSNTSLNVVINVIPF